MNPADIHILVIDDDEPTCLLISRQLQRDGYQVTTVRSGLKGLEYLTQHPVDVIFLDLLMPELSGYQVLGHLKADPVLAAISVIIVSAIDDLKDIVRCLDMGASDYILKPVNPLLLNIRLHTCLERQWLRQQEQRYLQQLRAERDSAETANRARSAFLANMSHELRTPLNAVIGYTGILQDEFEMEGHIEYLSDLTKIRGASKHLLRLIDDILDISKLESDQMEMTFESFTLETLVEQVWSEARSQAESNRNTLLLDLKLPKTMRLHTDPSKLRQILENLLRNALKFTTQGTIQLTVEADTPVGNGDWICFKVIDTGIGIPPEQQERIFEPFIQVDDSSTRLYSGTGLGLAICHRLSQLLGGHIHLVSAVNKGTTITLRLPTHLTPNEAIASRITHQRIPDALEQRQGLVVVVDGDRTVRDWMVQCINQDGYRVVTSWCGQDGMRLIQELHPALIGLGMTLPNGSCWKTLAALKADPMLMDIPVVLHDLMPAPSSLTPYGQVLGVCHLLIKPEHYPHILALLTPYTTDLSSKSVLVIQSDRSAQRMLERLLTRHDWTVHSSSTFPDALDHMRHQSPTAIILNLDMLGPTTVHDWRSLQARSPQIPIIYVLTRDVTLDDMARQPLHQLSGALNPLADSGMGTESQLATHLQSLTRAYCPSR